MDSELLGIGRMAELNHTTVPTLRLYDRLGLLRPCYTDPDSNYRYYDIKQNARLDMIQYMKELGMSLREIGDVLKKEDIGLIEEILLRKRGQNIAEMSRLRLQKSAIERTVRSIDRYRKSPASGTTTLEYIDAREIFSMSADVNFYNYDIETYEQLLKELKSHLIEHNIPQIYFCNAGTSIKREDFFSLNFRAESIFVFVDDDFPVREGTARIESGMYACIYLTGFEDEMRYAKRLLDFCNANHYLITGDYICEVLTEFSIFESGQRDMFLRLQVPVSFKNRA